MLKSFGYALLSGLLIAQLDQVKVSVISLLRPKTCQLVGDSALCTKTRRFQKSISLNRSEMGLTGVTSPARLCYTIV